MQLRAAFLIAVTAALLAGCEFRSKGGKDRDADAELSIGNASAGDGLTIRTPEFEGKLNIPGMTLGGRAMDLDGMKLPPGTKVTSIDVDAHGAGKDQVRIVFASDAAPQALADHFRREAQDAGYAVVAPTGGTEVRGTKEHGKSFAMTAAPAAGAGATGTIVMAGD